MEFKAKIAILALCATVLVLGASEIVRADSTSINATAEMLVAVQVGNEQDIQFGIIGNNGGIPGGADSITLASDGSLSATGIFDAPSTGTPGSVDVTAGTDGEVMEVFCDNFATMTNGAGASILLSIRTSVEGSTGPFASDNPCLGLGSPATTFTLNAGVLDTVFFSAFTNGAFMINFVNDSYSTGNAGGDDIVIDISYQ